MREKITIDQKSKMEQQLQKINNTDFSLYMELFGYNNIMFCFQNDITNKLCDIWKQNHIYCSNEENTEEETLYITETDKEKRSNKYTLNIVQFLYEMEVIANIPSEIKGLLKQEDLVAFLYRFLEISNKNQWLVVFAGKTPIFQKLLKKCDFEKQYLAKSFDKENIFEKEMNQKIFVVDKDTEKVVDKFYELNDAEKRIERCRLIVLFRVWIMENIYLYFKQQLEKKDVEVIALNCTWALNNPLFPKSKSNSKMIKKREEFGIYNLKGQFPKYKDFFQDIYGENTSEAYVESIMDIPPKIEVESGRIKHKDFINNNIKVFNGERYTTDQPLEYDNTIYMMGGCVVFGYAIEDKETIASYLQRHVNSFSANIRWRVVNLGVWGGNIDQTYKAFYELCYKPGDVILINYAGLMPLGNNYMQNDISKGMQNIKTDLEFYYNEIIHCNKYGYESMAKEIGNIIKNTLSKECILQKKSFYLQKNIENSGEISAELEEYLLMIKKLKPQEWGKKENVGGIVMNCNPFTLGHQYLISYASQQVDYLYIFVVEEDKSYFKFEDRFDLVKKGVEHLDNVCVIPSGKLIISSVTFPGYFVKDTPDKVEVDTSLDVTIFGQTISPAFNISKRFVGEEPFDIVTRQYNESMKQILPSFGVEVIEIPRKEEGDTAISASRVRKLLETKDAEAIKKLVPNSTYEYLRTKYLK